MLAEPEVLFETRGPIGLITLNRPKALNALTLGMCASIDAQLRAWETDPSVHAVVARGAGGRAYCAGGDVRAVADAGLAGKNGGDGRLTQDFFRTEYRMNRRLQRFPKPFVALIDGVTMGGGIGLSVHGSHRVATERTLAAMPETGIGLFPDVGASYVLPRLPGQFGTYLALTGARVHAADLLHLGIATDVIEAARLDALVDALVSVEWNGAAHDTVDAVLTGFRVDPGAPPLASLAGMIDACFGFDRVEEILKALDGHATSEASDAASVIRGHSPTSLKVTLAEMRRGASLSFDDCMVMEYRLTQSILAGHDFYEGIRALLIDKDKSPKWQPANLEAIDDASIAAFFAPPPSGDLTFED